LLTEATAESAEETRDRGPLFLASSLE